MRIEVLLPDRGDPNKVNYERLFFVNEDDLTPTKLQPLADYLLVDPMNGDIHIVGSLPDLVKREGGYCWLVAMSIGSVRKLLESANHPILGYL